MCSLELVRDTIGRAIATGQIGTPVASRLIVHPTQDHGRIEDLAIAAIETVVGWLDMEPQQLFASGGAAAGQITALLRGRKGQTALISVGVCGSGSPLLETLVFGNRGVLSWEAGGPLQAQSTPEVAGGGGAVDFRRSVLTSLADGHAISLNGGSQVSLPSVQSDPAEKLDPFAAGGPIKVARLDQPYGLLLVSGDYTHQPGYAEDLVADGRCRLIGVTDEPELTPRRRQLNERLAARLGIPVLPRLDEALARQDVGIVSICAEPIRRGEIIVKAAQAGKHLYLDKPFATSMEVTHKIVRAVREAGVVSHMFSQVHLDPAQQTRQLLAAGSLGDLTAVHYDLCFAKGRAGTASLGQPRKESAVPELYELADSKRELSNVGVYCLVTMLWALRRRVRRVFAATGNYFFAEHQQNDMEDFGQLMMEMEGGVTASISAGRSGWRCHPSGGINRIYLVGTQGTAVIDAHRPRVEVWADVEPWLPPDRDPDDPMGMWASVPDSPFRARPKQDWLTPASARGTADADHFLACVDSGQQSEVPVDLAAATTQILMAAYRSAAEGCAVELP